MTELADLLDTQARLKRVTVPMDCVQIQFLSLVHLLIFQFTQLNNLLTARFCCLLLVQAVEQYQHLFLSRIFWINQPSCFQLYNCTLTKYLLISFSLVHSVNSKSRLRTATAATVHR